MQTIMNQIISQIFFVIYLFIYLFILWSGGAIMLNLDERGQGPTVLAVGAGGGCLDIFLSSVISLFVSSVISLFFFPIWETAR